MRLVLIWQAVDGKGSSKWIIQKLDNKDCFPFYSYHESTMLCRSKFLGYVLCWEINNTGGLVDNSTKFVDQNDKLNVMHELVKGKGGISWLTIRYQGGEVLAGVVTSKVKL